MMNFAKVIFCLTVLASAGANASFYIDYQGLEKPEAEPKSKEQLISPDGYRLLTNDLQGLVYEIGPSEEAEKISSFADQIQLKNGIGTVIPEKWSAYIDEQMSADKTISFSAENESWLNVLARIGSDYGFKFVVDWEQMIVQISKDEHFIEPNPNDPVVTKGQNGQLYYIYKSKQEINKGMMLIDGELIPIKVSE